MARSRNIKPGFFTNDVLGELPALTRLLFAGLWVIADREGRLEDRPKKIRAEILPYDQCDADEMLQDLENNGFILRYTSGAFKVIQVLAWDKHQNPHVKEAPSTLPAYVEHQPSTVQEQFSAQPLPERAGLIPSSLIPDSSLLIPKSSSPAVTEAETSQADDDGDEKPKSPAEWIAVFAEQHGVDIDHRNFHDRKKFWPLAQAWTNAGITVGQMRAACAKAHADCTESIAWLPAYADRVLASMQSEKSPKAALQTESFKERDARIGRERWEQMTGRTHPDNLPKNAATVIDAQMLELTHD